MERKAEPVNGGRWPSQTFSAGSVIFREGDPGGDLLIIEAGEAEVFLERDGHHFSLAQLGPREIIGVMTVANAEPRTASVRALTDVTALLIRHQDIQKVLREVPSWSVSFMNDLVARVKYANARMVGSAALGQAREHPEFAVIAAMQLLKALPPLMRLTARDVDGKNVADLDACFALATEILTGDKESFQAALDVIASSALLRMVGLPRPGRFVAADDASGVDFFLEFARAYLTMKKDGALPIPFTIAERKALNVLATHARAQGNPKDAFVMGLKDAEDKVRAAGGGTLTSETLIRAETYGFLRLERSAPAPRLRFTANDVDHALISLEILRSLETGQSDLRIKRTLLY